MNALLLAPLLLVQAPKWTTYSAPADGLSFLAPGKVVVQNQATQGVKTNIFISMAPPFVCAVSKTNLPPNMKAADTAQMKAAMKSSMLATSQSTATGVKSATYSGIKGEQTGFKTASGGAGATWIAQRGNAVYSVTLVKKGGASPAEMARFFGSFKAR